MNTCYTRSSDISLLIISTALNPGRSRSNQQKRLVVIVGRSRRSEEGCDGALVRVPIVVEAASAGLPVRRHAHGVAGATRTWSQITILL